MKIRIEIHNNWKTLVAVVLAASFSAFASASAEKGAIELRALAEKQVVEVTADGEQTVRLVEPDKVIPGDTIVYTIGAKNVSQEAAESVVITDPIPEHMIYVPGSATSEGTKLLFSIDGGVGFDAPESLRVTESDGSTRPAKAGDYTHIRWVFNEPLLVATEKAVQFAARLQ
jgi:uncharacterized repeat protein (TIGR01451 family)